MGCILVIHNIQKHKNQLYGIIITLKTRLFLGLVDIYYSKFIKKGKYLYKCIGYQYISFCLLH